MSIERGLGQQQQLQQITNETKAQFLCLDGNNGKTQRRLVTNAKRVELKIFISHTVECVVV